MSFTFSDAKLHLLLQLELGRKMEVDQQSLRGEIDG